MATQARSAQVLPVAESPLARGPPPVGGRRASPAAAVATPPPGASAGAPAGVPRASPAPMSRGATMSSLLAKRVTTGPPALPRATGVRAVIATFGDAGVEAEYQSHQAARAVGARVALAVCVCVGHGALAFAVRAGDGGAVGYGAAAAGVGAFAAAAGLQGLRTARTHALARAAAAVAAAGGLYLASQTLPSWGFHVPLMLLVPSLFAVAYAVLLTPAAFALVAAAVIAASLAAEATGDAFAGRGAPSVAAVAAAAVAAVLHAVVFATLLTRAGATECESFAATRQLFEEEEVYSRILVRMMPERVIENLLSSQSLVTVATPGVSVIFAEIVHDFDIRRAADTEPFLYMLSTVFEEFDARVALRKAYKVLTFGCDYMAVSGVPAGEGHPTNTAEALVHLAHDMQKVVAISNLAPGARTISMRAGINTGPVMEAVIGDRMPRWSVFGDTVNTASRMKSHCKAGEVQVTEATAMMLPANISLSPARTVEVKGKGPMITRLALFTRYHHRRLGGDDDSTMIKFGSAVHTHRHLSAEADSTAARLLMTDIATPRLPHRVPVRGAAPATSAAAVEVDEELKAETATLEAETAFSSAAGAEKLAGKFNAAATVESMESFDGLVSLTAGVKTLVLGVSKITDGPPLLPFNSSVHVVVASRGDRPQSPRLMGKRAFGRGRHSDTLAADAGFAPPASVSPRSAVGSPRSAVISIAGWGSMRNVLDNGNGSKRNVMGSSSRRTKSVTGNPSSGPADSAQRLSVTSDAFDYGQVHRGVVDSVMEQMRERAPRRHSKAGTARSRHGSMSSAISRVLGRPASSDSKADGGVVIAAHPAPAAISTAASSASGAGSPRRRSAASERQASAAVAVAPVPADVARSSSVADFRRPSSVASERAGAPQSETLHARRTRHSVYGRLEHIEPNVGAIDVAAPPSVLGDIRASFRVGVEPTMSRRRLSIGNVKTSVARRESISDPYYSAATVTRRTSFLAGPDSISPSGSADASRWRQRASEAVRNVWWYSVDIAWSVFDASTWLHLTFPQDELEDEFRAHSVGQAPANAAAQIVPVALGESRGRAAGATAQPVDAARSGCSLQGAAYGRVLLVAVFLALGVVPMGCAIADVASGVTNLFWLIAARATIAIIAVFAAVVPLPSHAACAWSLASVATASVVCRLIYGLVSIAATPPLAFDRAWQLAISPCGFFSLADLALVVAGAFVLKLRIPAVFAVCVVATTLELVFGAVLEGALGAPLSTPVAYLTPILLIALLAMLQAAHLQETHDRESFVVLKASMQEKVHIKRLMDSMLPPVVTAAMIRVANGNATVVDSQLLTGRAFKGVSLLFLDIVSFTTLSAKISPALLVQLLNGIFCRFDEVIARHRAFKVETIGDAIFVAMGVPYAHSSHAAAIAEIGLAFMDAVLSYELAGVPPVKARVGIHTGQVTAGVVGHWMPRYHVFGEAVSCVMSLEASAPPGHVHASAEIYVLLKQDARFTCTARETSDADRGVDRVHSHHAPSDTGAAATYVVTANVHAVPQEGPRARTLPLLSPAAFSAAVS